MGGWEQEEVLRPWLLRKRRPHGGGRVSERASSPVTLQKCSPGANLVLTCGVPPAVRLQTQTESCLISPLWCPRCLWGAWQGSCGGQWPTEGHGGRGAEPHRGQHPSDSRLRWRFGILLVGEASLSGNPEVVFSDPVFRSVSVTSRDKRQSWRQPWQRGAAPPLEDGPQAPSVLAFRRPE